MKLFWKMEGVLSRFGAICIKLVTLNVPFVFLRFELVRITEFTPKKAGFLAGSN